MKKTHGLFVIIILMLLYFIFQSNKPNNEMQKFQKKENTEEIEKVIARNRGKEALTKTTRKIISRISMDKLLIFSRNYTFPNGIPKVVHYSYKSIMVPSQYIPLVQRCMEINEKVRFVFWTHSNALHLIKNYFPNNLKTIESYLDPNSDNLKQSDFIRYFILSYFGGIYMDLDTRCQKPFDEAMVEYSCIFGKEAEVQTRIQWDYEFVTTDSLMACIPYHSFLLKVLESIKEDHLHVIHLTGSLFLTNVFIEYNASLSKTDYKYPHKYVHAASSDLFSPLIEDYIGKNCVKPSGKWSMIVCKDLEEYKKSVSEKISKAIVVHLYLHLESMNKDKIKNMIDIGLMNNMNIVY